MNTFLLILYIVNNSKENSKSSFLNKLQLKNTSLENIPLNMEEYIASGKDHMTCGTCYKK